jgi:N4-(beta-N-acetylglucosaminyl)-L-asparaginase
MELLREHADPVDAAVAGVSLVEDDPKDHSVGYGGLPNEDGVVELDSCVMHGPTHQAGGVAALQRIRHPSQVAALVMRRTDHVLLVGEGALRFAKAHGFDEEELLTDEARRIWLKWKETHSDKDDWLHPEANEEAARRLRKLGLPFTYGTISCLALTAGGDLGGCTTTSGLSYKLPGRVGDSPIIGAGLYVDNGVGACGSTGRGEANLQNCSSFMIVELMRRGMTPTEASLEVLRRVAARTVKRLLDAAGEPNFGLTFYALRKDGVVGGASLRGPGRMAFHDGDRCRLVDVPGLYTALPDEE